jgi:hypothetical protein
MLDIARQYVAAGLSVIPIDWGGKYPDGRLLAETTGITTNWTPESAQAAWRIYAGRLPTDAELVAWFTESDAGIGIVGGQISGGLIRIDFEHKVCLPTWRELLKADAPALAFATTQLPIASTGKGHHVYFRMPDPVGHVLLCVGGGSGDSAIVFAETQGEGCYCVAPPSTGYHAYTFEPFSYAWISGSVQTIPTLDQELAGKLLDAARFRGLWETVLGADDVHDARTGFARMATPHRHGITLTDQRVEDRHVVSALTLTWAEIRALRAYLDRYAALLAAVEIAPPPPLSYDEGDDEGYDEEYD